MTTTTTTVSTSAGPTTVTATSPVPGLLIYEIPAEVSPMSEHRWILGHHEGRALAAFATDTEATAAAESVAELADWTRSVMTTANEISLGGKVETFGFLLMSNGGQHPNA
ncbi:hypothetical protein YUYDRAFT_02116 [Streptomyces sp. ScaeMP-e48]|uniref:hypothetical protein n=1 Tax=Streptomyces sp. ScaeMP-e48 TaxID=1100823 RepID=UPI000823838C|nr:hypothetical protein [Streptomyces sp. ScaeMP-e48]SCK20318.1 hypothetical protein YUYDRAFT_02116 [Streptomyces sp. ScaeMP-e48]